MAKQVDFEVVEKIEVVVVATDDGKPTSLQNTATIVITVDNINDENPEFTEVKTIVFSSVKPFSKFDSGDYFLGFVPA